MTVLEVQSATFSGSGGSWSGSFGANVTAGDTVYLIPYCYGGNAMASSAPKFGGSAVTGASAVVPGGQSPGASSVYSAVWQLPDLAGGSALVSLTNSGNGTIDGNVGMAAIEFSGLGASPAVDSGASPNPQSANSTTGAISSGSTGSITSPGVVIATGISYGQNVAGPASPWANLYSANVGFIMAGYQIPSSSGGSYDYSVSSAATAGWFAGVVAIKPGSGGTAHTATASLTVTPTFSAARTRGKYRTGSLTVTPSFSAARTRGRYRTGALLVTPSFSAARTHNHGRTASLLVTPAFSAARSRGHFRSGALVVVPSFRAVATGGAAPVVPQGSWWGLISVIRHSKAEFDAYRSMPPMACPRCGEPLRNGPATNAGSGIERYCPYDGWAYPRDFQAPSRADRW